MEEPGFVTRLRGRAKAALEQTHLEAARSTAAARAPETSAAPEEEITRRPLERPTPVLKPRSAWSRRPAPEPAASPPPPRASDPAQRYFESLKARVRGEIANDDSYVRESFRRSAERDR